MRSVFKDNQFQYWLVTKWQMRMIMFTLFACLFVILYLSWATYRMELALASSYKAYDEVIDACFFKKKRKR